MILWSVDTADEREVEKDSAVETGSTDDLRLDVSRLEGSDCTSQDNNEALYQKISMLQLRLDEVSKTLQAERE